MSCCYAGDRLPQRRKKRGGSGGTKGSEALRTGRRGAHILSLTTPKEQLEMPTECERLHLRAILSTHSDILRAESDALQLCSRLQWQSRTEEARQEAKRRLSAESQGMQRSGQWPFPVTMELRSGWPFLLRFVGPSLKMALLFLHSSHPPSSSTPTFHEVPHPSATRIPPSGSLREYGPVSQECDEDGHQRPSQGH